ncbi:MAG: DUF2807 domain-containing protein [Bacteroidales bacterium]|nr:DUF2807 domain-containing protein [Bacteroidales bacterium]
MKRILTISAILAALIISCFTAAGQTVKKDFDLKGFTGIELGNEFRATVQKSNSYGISVEVSEELVPYLDVRVSKGDLIIELRNVPTRLTLLKSNIMIAIISMPELKSVTLNGSSKITVANGFDLGDGSFALATAGTSEVRQMEIHAKNASLNLSGASRVHLDGDFIAVNIQSAGTSRLDMKASADDLTVKSSGAAVAEIDGTFDTLDLELGGTSNVTLKGEGEEMKVNASSAGSVDALRMPVATATVHLSGAGVCKTYVKEALEVQCTGASTCSYKTDGEIKLDLKEIARTATLKKL